MSSVEKPFVLLVDDNEATCTLITAVLHRDRLCATYCADVTVVCADAP